MSSRIEAYRHGGPEVLEWKSASVAEPASGEVALRHTAIGLNFIDVYHRTGLYQTSLPLVPGLEAAGVVEAVGDHVTNLQKGDRVAYGTGPLGAYTERRTMPADRLVKVPDAVSDEAAAAIMLKGLTAQYLVRRTCRIEAGDVVLLQAAAGGVGLIACQWLKHLGATVIGTVGNPEKGELARAHGADHVLIHGQDDVERTVRELTNGEGVRVAYDSIGQDTWEASMSSVRRLGTLVLFGQSSGVVPPMNPALLAEKGSLFLTRPTLADYVKTREELDQAASELFDVVGSGAVKPRIGQRFALKDAAEAHRALEGRRTTGSTLLLP